MKKEKTNVWKNYFHLLFQSKLPVGLLITGLVFALTESLATLFFDKNIGRIIPEGDDTLIDYSGMSVDELVRICGLLLALGLAALLAKVIVTYVSGLITAKVNRNIQNYAVKKVFRLKTAQLEETDSRELITRLTDDTAKSSEFVVELFVKELARIVVAVGAIVMIARFGVPTLVWSQIFQIPLIFAVSLLAGYITFKNRNKVQKKLAEVTARIAEKVDNIETIKSFRNEELEIERGNALLDEYDKVKKEAARVNKFNTLVDQITWILPLAVIIIPASLIMFKGGITPAIFMSYFALANSCNTALKDQVPVWIKLKEAQGASLRLSSVICTELENESAGETDIVEGDIVFDGVSVSYGENKALDNVSFTVKKGAKTALVGLSGSGKSTVLNLIEKFYEPDCGTITLGGRDIRGYDFLTYRSCFSYLPQNAPAFEGSVREVLEYSSEAPHSDGELRDALKRACVLDDIEALGGLDYQVGYNGEKLSGGQRQKLGIARLLLSAADYVLLDEVTSALDAESTKAVSAELDRFAEGKTTVIVSHDMETVENADAILVFDQGRLVAQGTHKELARGCDLYKTLVKEAK